MRKIKFRLLPVVIAALVLSGIAPKAPAYASEEEGYEENYEEETEEETEDPIPESYYLPIESNNTSGWPAGPQIEAEAAVVMDADTGAFLYSKNMYAKEYPASITKIMTALIAIEKGNLRSKITFSDYAVYSLEYGSSHAGIQSGEIMSMNRALYGLMLESANDVANGIAETVGGNIKGFTDMMNQKAEELGCVNTHFTNAHGLHEEDHYTCARDMALITQAAIAHPTFRKVAGTRSYTCPETNKVDEKRYWYNHNQMIQPEAEYYYEDCLGGKNGFTEDALNTLVTYAKRDGRTLICVELRVNGRDKAYSESHAMLNYAFDNFENVTVPVIENNITRSKLLGMDELGKLSLLQTSALARKLMDGSEQATVSVPKGTDISQIVKSADGEGGLSFTFNGWNVGSASLSFSPLSYEVPVPRTVPLTYTEIVEETEPGIKGMAQVALRKTKSFGQKAGKGLVRFGKSAGAAIGGFFGNLPERGKELVTLINENDIMAAVLGLVLLIILLPILGIAWARNARSKKIRKMRKKEREERTQIERNIDSKSISEIEAELRAEIEKDRLERQQIVEEVSELHVEEEKSKK